MSVATIDRSTVLQKTARGRAEIGRRQAGLSAVQRQLLIVIDGQKDVGAIAAMFPRADALDALAFLADEGLVGVAAPVSAEPVAAPAVDPAFDTFRRAIAAPLPAAAPLPPAVDAPADDPALAAARRFMAEAARAHIGLLGERLVARIEAAATPADLAAVASQWHMALRDSKRGKPLADDLLDQARALIGASIQH